MPRDVNRLGPQDPFDGDRATSNQKYPPLRRALREGTRRLSGRPNIFNLSRLNEEKAPPPGAEDHVHGLPARVSDDADLAGGAATGFAPPRRSTSHGSGAEPMELVQVAPW